MTVDAIREVGQAVALVGGGFAGVVWGTDRFLGALLKIEKAPGWYKRVRSEKAHQIVAQEEQRANLALIAPLASDVARVVAGFDRLVTGHDELRAVILPNGGSSISDKVTRIDGKLTEHIESMDESLNTIFENLAEHGHEINTMRRGIRDHIAAHSGGSPEEAQP